MGALEPGRIFQTAFVVEDLDTAIESFSRDLNIGGWLQVGGKRPWPAVYRGNEVGLNVRVALGFSGDMMFELIQQTDEAPSVYREIGGFGLHHFAIAEAGLPATLARYAAEGLEPILTLDGAQGQAAYLDVRPRLPAMLELVQITPSFEAFIGMIRDLSRPCDKDGPFVQRL